MTSSTSSSTATRSGNVRQVKLYNVVTPPTSGPEIYELDSNAGEQDWYSACMVMDKTYEVYSLDGCDDVDEPQLDWSQDPLFCWYSMVTAATSLTSCR